MMEKLSGFCHSRLGKDVQLDMLEICGNSSSDPESEISTIQYKRNAMPIVVLGVRQTSSEDTLKAHQIH